MGLLKKMLCVFRHCFSYLLQMYLYKKLLHYTGTFLPSAALWCLHVPSIVCWDLDVSCVSMKI